MAIKDYSELIQDFSDNETGSILPENIRDILETLATERVEVYHEQDIQIICHSTSRQYEQIPFTGITPVSSDNISIASDGTITVKGDNDAIYRMYMHVPVDSPSYPHGNYLTLKFMNHKSNEFKVYKNGNRKKLDLYVIGEVYVRNGSGYTITPEISWSSAAGEQGSVLNISSIRMWVRRLPAITTA